MSLFVSPKFNKWTRDLLHVIYPQNCLICQHEFNQSKLAICPICLSELSYTQFENYQEASNLDKLFWGRVQLAGTYALLRFKQENSTQRILHELKYKNNSEVGIHFGKEMGLKIGLMEQFKDADALIPVPLHPKKEFIRGYNQSEIISKGISETSGIEIRTDLLKRTSFTESQTKKGRTSRWDNMQNRFKLQAKKENKLQHLIIVDDVATTGSTLETCVRILRNQFPDAKISVVVLAVAE
ncbi:ComF family protein [Fluviicola taffensis]|uniref:Phosphoribosyltransferase n=1 Tax=Fluviicola taffensis (strain DSM 16823 / NCIMB 13979 / RW262) TaxID=755732 RepID=F2II85_FLUTR|nr:phosphoribosyltransferase family protein [Fluviicola taffensis]AEA43794.1 phosphoribosyltransferase [Fluviicola taffensis DSM 16823]